MPLVALENTKSTEAASAGQCWTLWGVCRNMGGGHRQGRVGYLGAYRPSKWKEEQSHVVVRLRSERQGELLPRFSVVLATTARPLGSFTRRSRP